MTNYECIKNMTIDELTDFITLYGGGEMIGDLWCRDFCEHRLPKHECKIQKCDYMGEKAVRAWMEKEGEMNNV